MKLRGVFFRRAVLGLADCSKKFRTWNFPTALVRSLGRRQSNSHNLSPCRATSVRLARPVSVSCDLSDLFPFRTTSFRPLSVPCDLFPRLTSFRLARPLSVLFLCHATSFLDRPLSVSCDLFPRSTSFRFARPLSDLFPCRTTSLLDRPLSDSHDLSPTSFRSLHDLVWRSCCFLPSSDDLCPTSLRPLSDLVQ